MARAIIFLVVLIVAVAAIMVRLRKTGLSLRGGFKLAALAAGFVVTIKMMIGSYLILRQSGHLAVDVIGFCGTLALALFFGVAIRSLLRREAKKNDSLG